MKARGSAVIFYVNHHWLNENKSSFIIVSGLSEVRFFFLNVFAFWNKAAVYGRRGSHGSAVSIPADMSHSVFAHFNSAF